MKLIFQYRIHLWIFYGLLAFPLFYFVYKHLNLGLGYKDFKQYALLYSDWQFDKVDAPYNMRLISSYLVYLLGKLNFYWPTQTTFETLFPDGDKVAYFNAVLVNFLSLVATAVIMHKLVASLLKNRIVALMTGMLLLLGFGSIFYLMAPLTDCFSVLLFAIVLYCYERKSSWIIFFFLAAIFQREYIFICFAILGLIDFYKSRNKYYIYIFSAAVICFVTYAVLRKTVFYSPLFANQLSPAKSLESFAESLETWPVILRQLLLTMNIVLVYIGVILYKKYRNMSWSKFNALKLTALFLVTNLIGLASMVGNNAGRVFYLCIPIVLYCLAAELNPMFQLTKINGNNR